MVIGTVAAVSAFVGVLFGAVIALSAVWFVVRLGVGRASIEGHRHEDDETDIERSTCTTTEACDTTETCDEGTSCLDDSHSSSPGFFGP